jgi:hypothetical protein
MKDNKILVISRALRIFKVGKNSSSNGEISYSGYYRSKSNNRQRCIHAFLIYCNITYLKIKVKINFVLLMSRKHKEKWSTDPLNFNLGSVIS